MNLSLNFARMQRLGVCKYRQHGDGSQKCSVLTVDMTIRTNDNKEELLLAVEGLKKEIARLIEEKYDSFVVPDESLPIESPAGPRPSLN